MEEELHPYVEITENDVKKVTMRFLKHHYRFRPRSVDAFISADMRGMGGIVADGYLAFPQDDGQLFVATFEATSADTRHEVQFSVRRESLLWDALAFAFFLTTTLRFGAHELGWLMLNDLGIWFWWATLAVSVLVLAFLYQKSFRSLRRYRYIHAVEQFKQYHADDQWIAISEFVFPGTEHVYFKELRRQCIKYGFGLIIIDRHFHPHLYITPAKEDQFHHRRGSIEFVRQSEWMQQIRRSRYVEMLRKRAPWLFRERERKGLPRRFRQTYYPNLVIIFFSLLGMSGVFYRQWEKRPMEFLEQEEYVLERLRQMQDNALEPMIYLIDSAQIWPIQKDLRPYMGELWEDPPAAGDGRGAPGEEGERADVIVNLGDNEFVLYDCTRFFNLDGKKYLVQEGMYADLELATRRMYQLSAQGVRASTIWAGCFSGGEQGYIVYLDELYNSLPEASAQADAIQDSLAAANIEMKLDIKIVYPNE